MEQIIVHPSNAIKPPSAAAVAASTALRGIVRRPASLDRSANGAIVHRRSDADRRRAERLEAALTVARTVSLHCDTVGLTWRLFGEVVDDAVGATFTLPRGDDSSSSSSAYSPTVRVLVTSMMDADDVLASKDHDDDAKMDQGSMTKRQRRELDTRRRLHDLVCHLRVAAGATDVTAAVLPLSSAPQGSSWPRPAHHLRMGGGIGVVDVALYDAFRTPACDFVNFSHEALCISVHGLGVMVRDPTYDDVNLFGGIAVLERLAGLRRGKTVMTQRFYEDEGFLSKKAAGDEGVASRRLWNASLLRRQARLEDVGLDVAGPGVARTQPRPQSSCPVCMNKGRRSVQLVCGHVFCVDCLTTNMSMSAAGGEAATSSCSRGKCMLCRAPVRWPIVAAA
jgi:hypothetical protein